MHRKQIENVAEKVFALISIAMSSKTLFCRLKMNSIWGTVETLFDDANRKLLFKSTVFNFCRALEGCS